MGSELHCFWESRLESQLGKVTEMVQQIATMLMGGGALSLPESLKEELVGTIRKEFEYLVQTLKFMYEKEMEEFDFTHQFLRNNKTFVFIGPTGPK